MIAAVVEAGAGLALLLIPGVASSALFGAPPDTPAGLVAARIAGAALFALAVACWRARNGERGSPATGVVEAMLFYNFAGRDGAHIRRHSFGPPQRIALAGDRFAS